MLEHHIKKIIKIFKDQDFPHKPDILGMVIIDFDEDNITYITNLNEMKLKQETKEILENDFSNETFIQNVRALCELKR